MKSIRLFLIPVTAVSITLLVLWYAHGPTPPAASSMAQVQQEAHKGGYRLIDLETLARRYRSDRNKIFIVDTRQAWEHRAGHIAASVNFPLEPTWLERWQKKEDLQAFLGPDKEKAIVFY